MSMNWGQALAQVERYKDALHEAEYQRTVVKPALAARRLAAAGRSERTLLFGRLLARLGSQLSLWECLLRQRVAPRGNVDCGLGRWEPI